jgi:hypothetical protein
MSPLRVRMIEDMTLAGLALGTQQTYIYAVRQLAAANPTQGSHLGRNDVTNHPARAASKSKSVLVLLSGRRPRRIHLPRYRAS